MIAIKWLPALSAAHGLLHALEEILLVDVGFECAAGFAGNDKERFGEVNLFFDASDLRRIGRVEYVQAREARGLRIGQREHFRTKAGSAHAKQQYVGEPGALDLVGQVAKLGGAGELFVGDAEPAQPVGLVIAGPKGGVALPEPSYLSRRPPVVKVFFYRSVKIARKRCGLSIDLRRGRGCSLRILLDRGQQGVEGVGK